LFRVRLVCSRTQVMSMIPGFKQEMFPQGHEKASQEKFQRYLTMMDSMTDAELDHPKGIVEKTRIIRVARGSGRRIEEVVELMTEYNRLAKAWSKMGKLKLPKKGDMNALARNQNAAQMSKMLAQANPAMLKQMGGAAGLSNMMKQMQDLEKSGSLGNLLGGMGL